MSDCIYIPPTSRTAERHLRRALAAEIKELSKRDFMKAYCSLAYRYPGFHPDDMEDWDGPPEILPIAQEAWRRAEAGKLTDSELYPYQATKAGLREGNAAAGKG